MGKQFVAAALLSLWCQAVAWADAPAETAALPAGVALWKVAGKLGVGAVDRRLVVFDLSDPKNPQKVSERELAGVIVDLRIVDGAVFAVVARTEAAAFQLGPAGQLAEFRASLPEAAAAAGGDKPAVAPEPKPSASAAPSSAPSRNLQLAGKIAKVQRGTVLVDLDEGAAIRPGDALLVRTQRLDRKLNLFSGREEEAVSNAPVAVIEVRQVQGRQAVAELARGDQAEVGDTIEKTDRPLRGTPMFAPRVGYQSWAKATVRPFPNTGAIDFGSLTDIAAGYYWEFLHFQVRAAPVGISIPQAVKAVNAHALVSYQNDMAEFGIGGGYFSHVFEGTYSGECDQSGYGEVATARVDAASGTSRTAYDCKQAGPTFAQHLRLGSVDGLNLRVTNALAVDRGKFRFGYIEASGDLPLSRSLNLFVAGGGSAGLRWGEAGIRTYLRGVGGAETLILTTGLGATSMRSAEIFGRKQGTTDVGGVPVTEYSDGEKSVGGLHIAVGLEVRL